MILPPLAGPHVHPSYYVHRSQPDQGSTSGAAGAPSSTFSGNSSHQVIAATRPGITAPGLIVAEPASHYQRKTPVLGNEGQPAFAGLMPVRQNPGDSALVHHSMALSIISQSPRDRVLAAGAWDLPALGYGLTSKPAAFISSWSVFMSMDVELIAEAAAKTSPFL